MKAVIKNIFCGLVIGSSMLIPGVSGGTTAIILGIYDRLIKAVSELLHDFKRNMGFLMQVALGGLIGVILFSKAVLWLVGEFYFPMMYFFIGAILGSIPLMLKKAKIQKSNFYYIVFAFFGVLAALSVKILPKASFSAIPDSIGGIAMLLLCGIVIAVALILPGISTSHILLVLGMYETVLQAVSEMNWLYIGILGTGVIIGIFLCTKLLEKAMCRFPSQTFMAIIGFIMASVYDIFPGIPSGIEVLICLFTFALAFTLVSGLSMKQP